MTVQEVRYDDYLFTSSSFNKREEEGREGLMDRWMDRSMDR